MSNKPIAGISALRVLVSPGVCACKIEGKCGHSQMELISDKWVFKGFEMDSGL